MKKAALVALALLVVLPCFATIQYAGGTNISVTMNSPAGTRRELVDWISATCLHAAGWAYIAPSDGTTADELLQTASTPNSNQIQYRFYDAGSGNVSVYMRNVAGTKVTAARALAPGAGKVWQCIANKYQYFVFTVGTTANNEFMAGGVLYVPTFLAAAITGDFGWMETGVTVASSLRYTLANYGYNYAAGLVNNNLLDASMDTDNGTLQLVSVSPGHTTTAGFPYRWYDGSLQIVEPLMGWGLTAASAECKLYGQLWDAMIVSDAFAGDYVLPNQVDSHTWYAITNNNVGTAAVVKGTLFLVIP